MGRLPNFLRDGSFALLMKDRISGSAKGLAKGDSFRRSRHTIASL
jgi:hypothetical protein